VSALFIITDVLLEDNNLLQVKLKKRDVETMKVLHDFKNPINSIKAKIECSNSDETFSNSIYFELDDMTNMMENLKTEFKFKNEMDFSELQV